MLGTRASRISGGAAGPCAGCACRPTIEDRFAALQPRACGRGRRSGLDGGFVNRARAGLRHHHAAHGSRRRSGYSSRRVGGGRSSCSGDARSGSSRADGSFGCGCGGRLNRSRCSGGRGNRLDGGLGRDRRFGRMGRLFAWRVWRRGRFHHHGSRRRRHNHHRPLRNCRRRLGCGGRGLGHDCARGRLGSDGRRGRRSHDRRSRTRLRNDLPGGRGRRRGRACRSCRRRRRAQGRLGRRSRRGRARRHPDRTRPIFLCLLLGQHGLQHIAGLGDMRQIDLGSDRRPALPRRRAALSGGAPIALKMGAHFLRFVLLQRAGMGLARAHSELSQYFEHLTALDFQFAREIVDSNLAHPPLFKSLPPKPSCS